MVAAAVEILKKYKSYILYLAFGAGTTLINLITYQMCYYALEISNVNAVIFAWLAAVMFAFVTNKLWVFESKSWSIKVLLKEIPSFFAARVLSFLIEEFGLYVFVDLLSFNEISLKILSFEIGGELIAKVILAVIVVILNYVFSKLVIFKKKK